MIDIISSALDANQFAPEDGCLVSVFDEVEQLQQCSSSLGIWHFKAKEGNETVNTRVPLFSCWKKKNRRNCFKIVLAAHLDLQTSSESAPNRILFSCSFAPRQADLSQDPSSSFSCSFTTSELQSRCLFTSSSANTRRAREKKHTVLLHSTAQTSYHRRELPLQKTITAVSGENRQPIRARRLIWRDATPPPTSSGTDAQTGRLESRSESGNAKQRLFKKKLLFSLW